LPNFAERGIQIYPNQFIVFIKFHTHILTEVALYNILVHLHGNLQNTDKKFSNKTIKKLRNTHVNVVRSMLNKLFRKWQK